MADGRYVIADDECGYWGHLFGPGNNETMTRFAFDREQNEIVCAEHLSGGAWLPMDEIMLDNFHDHLVNANPDALESPEQWSLRASDEIPDWARSPAAGMR